MIKVISNLKRFLACSVALILCAGALGARHFDYDSVDQKLDEFTSKHDRIATTLGQTTQFLGGIGGTLASGALTLGSIETVNTTGVALGGSAGIALSSVYAYDGLDDLLSPYKSTTGERAMASLKGELPGLTGKSKAAFSLANTLLDIGGIAAGAKVISTLQKPTLSSELVPTKSVTTQVENTITGDSSHLYSAKVRDVENVEVIRKTIKKSENNLSINSAKRAPEFRGGKLSESEFLQSAIEYLGKNYKSLPNGRYVSHDGLRQVRYGKHEISSKQHHAHFESYDKPGGQIVENTMVEIVKGK